jgi:hypothetical protein
MVLTRFSRYAVGAPEVMKPTLLWIILIEIIVADVRMIHQEARKPISRAQEAPFTPTACPYCRSPHITVDQARA